MTKFLIAWGEYAKMLDKQLDHDRSMSKMRKVLHDPLVEGMLQDKMTEE